MARKKKEEKPIEAEAVKVEETTYNLGCGLVELRMTGFLLEDGFVLTPEMENNEAFMRHFKSALETGLVWHS